MHLEFTLLTLVVYSRIPRIRAENSISTSFFIESLFEKYSGDHNGSVDVGKLLSGLNIGKSSGYVSNRKCFTASQLLRLFSLNTTQLDKRAFTQVCPAVLQQVDNKDCHRVPNKTAVYREPKLKAWGYGFLAVTVVNIAPLLGVTVVPCMSARMYKTVLLFMVSLAVGVLCGGSVFHLIPMTLGLGGHEADDDQSKETDYLFKSTVIVGGIYLFFLLEYLLKMYVRFGDEPSDNGGNSSGHGHSHNIESLLLRKKEKKETVADVQVEFYNVLEDHHRAHSNSICISNEMGYQDKPEKQVTDEPCKEPVRVDDAKMSQSRENLTDPPEQKVKPIAWTIVIGDCLHNFIDGIAMGSAFSSSVIQGFSTAIAICGEEVPHELGDLAVLLSAGMKYKHAVLFNVLSGVICYMGLVLGLLISYAASSSVKWVYALASGMFLYISLVDMLPEASEMSCKEGEQSFRANLRTFALQNFGMLTGYSIMFLLGLYAHDIQL